MQIAKKIFFILMLLVLSFVEIVLAEQNNNNLKNNIKEDKKVEVNKKEEGNKKEAEKMKIKGEKDWKVETKITFSRNGIDFSPEKYFYTNEDIFVKIDICATIDSWWIDRFKNIQTTLKFFKDKDLYIEKIEGAILEPSNEENAIVYNFNIIGTERIKPTDKNKYVDTKDTRLLFLVKAKKPLKTKINIEYDDQILPNYDYQRTLIFKEHDKK